MSAIDPSTADGRVRTTLLAALAASLSLSIAVQQTALASVLAYLAYACWRTRTLPRSPLDRAVAWWLAAYACATLFSPDPLGSLRGYPKLWLVGALVATYHLTRTRREIERLVWLWVAVAALVAGYGVVQHFTGIDLARELLGKAPKVDPVWLGANGGYRTKGLQSSAITYAHNLLFPLTFAGVLLGGAGGRRRARAGLVVAWLLMALALAFSLTRGAWLAAATVLALLAAIRRGRHGGAALAALAVLGLFLFGLGPGVRQRAASVVDVAANVGRTQIWRANLDMIAERPLLGWGYGNYKRFRAPFYARYPAADTTAHAHNNFLQVTVDAGVLGLLAFVHLFVVVLAHGWRTYRRLPPDDEPLRSVVLAGVLAVAAFLIAGLTQYNFGDAEVAVALWFTVAVLLRAGTLAREIPASATAPSAAAVGGARR